VGVFLLERKKVFSSFTLQVDLSDLAIPEHVSFDLFVQLLDFHITHRSNVAIGQHPKLQMLNIRFSIFRGQNLLLLCSFVQYLMLPQSNCATVMNFGFSSFFICLWTGENYLP